MSDLALRPDGGQLVALAGGSSAALWLTSPAQEIARWKVRCCVGRFDYSATGQWLAVADFDDRRPRTVFLDARDGREVAELAGASFPPEVAFGAGNGVAVVEVSTEAADKTHIVVWTEDWAKLPRLAHPTEPRWGEVYEARQAEIAREKQRAADAESAHRTTDVREAAAKELAAQLEADKREGEARKARDRRAVTFRKTLRGSRKGKA